MYNTLKKQHLTDFTKIAHHTCKRLFSHEKLQPHHWQVYPEGTNTMHLNLICIICKLQKVLNKID